MTPGAMNRRRFLRRTAAALGGTLGFGLSRSRAATATAVGEPAEDDDAIRERIEAHRPSQLQVLPPDFNDRVGATHVAGKYHLTDEPFLLEGARKLLALGTRLGKFWFTPNGIAGSYPFNSRWETTPDFMALAKSDHFAELFDLPFKTLILEAHSPTGEGWRRADLTEEFYQRETQAFHDLTAHLYRTYRHRDFTIVLQHWEGDWLLRGRGGELWNPPPADWEERCVRMRRWLSARQLGVSRARAEYGQSAKCRVAHAAEVNRVADLWKGIPTMTEHVLPHVGLDLVSYSCYDGMRDPLTLWKCIQGIRRHARTGPLFGEKAVFVGEIGVPENDQPKRVTERWDEWMGALLAADVKHVVQWELYCNEFSRRAPEDVRTPVTDPDHLRGFWLVKPDGSLSETGRYFQELWSREASS